ncbi:MAG: class I mannose-6-phosphate isomerase [Qipengyuania sp.]
MKLSARSVEKVWGRTRLPPPFDCEVEQPVGEIWFEPPLAADELLIKYLFTSEKLSVQVHPAAGQAGEGVAGKDECWLVLDAQPDASLAIGFDAPIGAAAMRRAALDGSIEDLLTWHKVQAGDFFYLPANTVHAIGPGLALVEVQQNTDITYRLFDYGRPRELHLENGLRVAKGEPYRDSRSRRVDPAAAVVLVDGPHFRLDQCLGRPAADVLQAHAGGAQILPISGRIGLSGNIVEAGECAFAQDIHEADFSQAQRTLIVSPRAG